MFSYVLEGSEGIIFGNGEIEARCPGRRAFAHTASLHPAPLRHVNRAVLNFPMPGVYQGLGASHRPLESPGPSVSLRMFLSIIQASLCKPPVFLCSLSFLTALLKTSELDCEIAPSWPLLCFVALSRSFSVPVSVYTLCITLGNLDFQLLSFCSRSTR